MNKIKNFFILFFAVYGVLWTIIESVSYFFQDLTLTGWIKYASLVLISFVISGVSSRKKSKISFKIGNSDTTVELTFGDLFNSTSCKVISVNEFFDSELGDHVSINSLHGYFIKNILNGVSTSFETLVDQSLIGYRSEDVERLSGRQKKYPIGTTAKVEINEQKYFLVAIAHTNLEDLKAYADMHDLWNALDGLWQTARSASNGDSIALPLMGTGLAGIGLPPKQILNLILTSIFHETKKQQICKKISIVIHSNFKDEIDLELIKRQWS